MGVMELLFGAEPQLSDEIDAPPRGVRLRRVRPRAGSATRAWRAEADCDIETSDGVLHARGGEDYVVAHTPEDRAVVRGDIFEVTYEPLGGGLYRKRSDVALHYFTLNRPVIVQTLEGPQRAAPGDWIMQGVAGELWPITPDKAREKYEPA